MTRRPHIDATGRRADSEGVRTKLISAVPRVILSSEDIEEVFDSPQDVLRIDDVNDTVMRWVIHDGLQEAEIAWLLPLGAPVASLYDVFKATTLEVARLYSPRVRKYETVARFPGGPDGQMRIETWHNIFTTFVVEHVTMNESQWWEARGPFSDILRTVKQWH